MEAHDANDVGGDINGGIQDIRQLVFRPWPTLDPYRVGDGLYLCSSSTPPGGGVHGMSGMLAARSALRHELQASGRASGDRRASRGPARRRASRLNSRTRTSTARCAAAGRRARASRISVGQSLALPPALRAAGRLGLVVRQLPLALP